MSLALGTRFDSYEIVGKLGAGGMGEVWRAHDFQLKRDVAVKVLPDSFAADSDRLARFRREAEILAACNHANIAQIYGLQEVDGQLAIIMEVVEGPTLAERIAEGPLPADEAMGIALQILAALETAHGRQIVHRDLKPANIKLTDDSAVKVLDFGISKPLATSAISGGSPAMTTPAATETGVILGTAAYMSPEQARGKPVDARTDIWAFGCILFEMLTGQPAFGGEDVMLTLARVLDRETDLTSIPMTTSAAIRHTIRMCLQKDPRQRIADVRDVRLALEGRFEGERQESGVRGEGRRFWPAAAVLAILAAAAASLLTFHTRPGNQASPPQIRRSVLAIPSGQLSMSAASFSSVVLGISPDGSEFVFSGNAGLYRRLLSEFDAHLVPGTDDDFVIDPHYSADGRSILYATNVRSANLKLVAIEGGRPQIVLDRMPRTGWQWPADDTIYYADDDGGDCIVWRDSPSGGDATRVLDVHDFLCIEPAPLPDGRRLIFDRHIDGAMEQAEIVVYEPGSDSPEIRFPGKQPQLAGPYLFYYEYSLGLVAQEFDPDSLARGERIVVASDVLEYPGRIPQFRVSPSGTLIYLRDTERPSRLGGSIVIMDQQGEVKRRLDLPLGNYSMPSVSPSGDRVALVSATDGMSDVLVYDLDGSSEPRQLTYTGDRFLPVWSPDGQWIVYGSTTGDGLYRRRADGGGQEEQLVTPEANRRVFAPGYDTQGRLTYTVLSENMSLGIWVLPESGGDVEPLIDERGVAGARFSSDGKATAYMVRTDESSEVWIGSYPPGERDLRVSLAGENPTGVGWIGDNTLGYQIGQEIMAVDVDTATLGVSNRRSLPIPLPPVRRELAQAFNARIASVPGTADILVIRDALSGSDDAAPESLEMVIVENVLEDVKARMAARN